MISFKDNIITIPVGTKFIIPNGLNNTVYTTSQNLHIEMPTKKYVIEYESLYYCDDDYYELELPVNIKLVELYKLSEHGLEYRDNNNRIYRHVFDTYDSAVEYIKESLSSEYNKSISQVESVIEKYRKLLNEV